MENARLLLNAGADLYATGPDGIKDGVHMINAAIVEHRTDLAELILDSEAQGKYGDKAIMREALTIATFRRQPDTIDLLLSKGADINGTNSAGQTALHVAAKTGYLQTVKLLVSHGADRSIRDKVGKTAADYTADWPNKPELAQTVKF